MVFKVTTSPVDLTWPLFKVDLMFAASLYLDAWREGRLPLAPRRLLRLVPPWRLLLIRVPRRGTRVGSTRTAPGAAAPFPRWPPAPVHRLPLVVPQPLVAVPGRAGRGGLVGVKGRLGVGGQLWCFSITHETTEMSLHSWGMFTLACLVSRQFVGIYNGHYTLSSLPF